MGGVGKKKKGGKGGKGTTGGEEGSLGSRHITFLDVKKAVS